MIDRKYLENMVSMNIIINCIIAIGKIVYRRAYFIGSF